MKKLLLVLFVVVTFSLPLMAQNAGLPGAATAPSAHSNSSASTPGAHAKGGKHHRKHRGHHRKHGQHHHKKNAKRR